MSVISKKLWLMICVLAASVLFVSWAVCEEPEGSSSAQETMPAQETTPAEETQAEAATEWIWGEVISVNNQANQLTLKYMNEDNLEEKEFTVNVDDNTVYEEVQSLLDIKPGDNISVDYTVSQEGVNLAKKIAVEKAQETGLSLPEAESNSTQLTYPY